MQGPPMSFEVAPSGGNATDNTSKEACLSDGGYLPQQSMAALQRRTSQALAALAVLSALCVALLGISIAALVIAKDAQAGVSAQAVPSASSARADSSASAAVGGAGVYTSTSPTSPQGYLSAGSLYRGSGYWSNSSSNLPEPRSDFATVLLPDADQSLPEQVLIVGGLGSQGAPVDSVLAYNAVLDAWDASLPRMPTPRSRLAAAAVGSEQVVVVGGYKDAAALAAQAPEACVLIYTASSRTWASDCTGDVAVADACAAAINGKVYVAGGTAAGGKLSSAIRAYDPVAKTWSQAGSLPTAAADVACAAVGDALYIAGGRSADGAPLRTLSRLDTKTGTLDALSPMPSGGGNMELVALPSGSLVAVGGVGTSAGGVQAPVHDVQEYIPAVDTWVQKAPIALARVRAGAAYTNGGLYAFGGVQRCTAPSAGGACAESPFADVEVFYDVEHPPVFLHLRDPTADDAPEPPASQVLLRSDATPQAGYAAAGLLHAGSGYWAPEQPLPVPSLADHSVVAVGNSLFILGGNMPSSETVSAAVYEFDTLLSEYTRLADMPAPRTRAGAAALGGKLYVVGGYSTVSEAEGPQGMLVYDIAAGTWSASAAKLNVPRTDACMAAVGGLLYIGGGYSTNYTETLSSVEVFDPNTDTWTQLQQPMPTPRGDVMCSALSLGGVEHFVVVGGYFDPTNAFTIGAFRSEVEAYNPEDASWTTLAPIPEARGDNALVTLPGNRLMVLGGETDTEGRNQVASNDAEIYLADHDVWVPAAPMPEPRFRFDAAFANGFVYSFGGGTTSACTPDGNCTARGGAQTAFKFLDANHPDVFVFIKE